MQHKPIIGITWCSSLDDYVASVEKAGGHPRILETSRSPRIVVEEIDGLLLTGGGDIDPVFYGEDRHPAVGDAEPGRDEFEIDLARRAMERGLAVLAICRGAQVLNVAAGGTLVQDIPTAAATALTHSIEKPKTEIAHEVAVVSGSRLEQALGRSAGSSSACPVNSRHHQSIATLGRSLETAAVAPDGVVEAIEKTDAEFCIGVQWHPENFWRTGEFSGLFDSFISAAKSRSLGP